jgi:hypothetical protein
MSAAFCRVNRFSGLDIALAMLAKEMAGGVAIVWIEPAARRIENRASHNLLPFNLNEKSLQAACSKRSAVARRIGHKR